MPSATARQFQAVAARLHDGPQQTMTAVRLMGGVIADAERHVVEQHPAVGDDVPLLGADRLAVLPVRNHRVVTSLLDGNAARHQRY